MDSADYYYYVNGLASVSYKGSQLVITETDKEEEDGESYEMSMVYYFNEVKGLGMLYSEN